MNTLEALKVIREECRKHGTCRDCPIRTTEGECKFDGRGLPSNWKFYDDPREEEENVRYFVD